MKLTIHTKLEIDFDTSKAFEDMARLYNKIKRDLYVDAVSKETSLYSFKNQYLKKYGITARQFNAIRIDLAGMLESRKKLQKLDEYRLKEKVKSLKKKISKEEERLGKKEGLSQKKRIKLSIHGKKRKLQNTREKLSRLKEDIKKGITRICFGSKKLFLKQFNLEANNYDTHEEWKEDWEQARNSNFYFVGSKDESYGNQSCQLRDDTLKIRVPNQLIEKHGKFIEIKNVSFSYRQDQLDIALEQERALSHRFVLKDKEWYLYTSLDYEKVEVKTLSPREVGAIGVDLNVNNVAIAETDRFGNPVLRKTYSTDVSNKTKDQTLAIYGDCSKLIVEHAQKEKKPIVIEKLDFTKKKASLKEHGKKYARMLSSFSYNAFLSILKRKAYTKGVKVYEVNPAFTSVIGKTKFMGRYGMTPHESAAVVIARRICNYSEKIPSKYASPLLEKIKGQHVWKKWSFLKNKIFGVRHHMFYQWRSLQDAAGLSFRPKPPDEIFLEKACGAR